MSIFNHTKTVNEMETQKLRSSVIKINRWLKANIKYASCKAQGDSIVFTNLGTFDSGRMIAETATGLVWAWSGLNMIKPTGAALRSEPKSSSSTTEEEMFKQILITVAVSDWCKIVAAEGAGKINIVGYSQRGTDGMDAVITFN